MKTLKLKIYVDFDSVKDIYEACEKRWHILRHHPGDSTPFYESHRTDGPAVIMLDIREQYTYINGAYIHSEKF